MKYTNEKARRHRALLMICTMLVGLFQVGVYAVEPSGLQTSLGTTVYTAGGDSVIVDANLTIEGIGDAHVSEASILIRNLENGDQLYFENANGITGTYNATNGILSLVGEATVENYQNALRSVKFSTTSDTTTRTIDFVLGSGLFFEGTGHFYEYVSTGEAAISWQQAKLEAEGRSFYGREGYLVTITSILENAFVLDKAQGIGWIGARDVNRNVDTGSFITGGLSNGDWRWVTGPEGLADGANGLKFYTGYSGHSPQGVGDVYHNWATSEPNSSIYSPGTAEWVAHIFGKVPPEWAPINAAGKWNDFHPTQESVYGYIVEYGGMADDSLINIQSSKVITIYDATQDNADILTAKGSIEGATYTAAQVEAEDATAASTKAQNLVNGLDLEGTTVVVVPNTFIAAEAGTSGNLNGTNGSFTFIATINKGGGTEQVSAEQTMTIIATEYTGISDLEAVAEAKAAIMTALNNLTVNNATTANYLLTAANNASLHGVSVAWNGTNGFSKTNATSSDAGSIIGILNLSLNSVSDTITLNKSIAKLAPSTGDTSTFVPQPIQETVVIIVNGKEQNAGTENTTTEDGMSTVTVAVRNEVIESRIDAAVKDNTTGTGNSIQIPITNKNSQIAKVELTGDMVKKLEANDFEISVKRDNIEYIIPADEFTISQVAETLKILEKDLKEIKVEVRITKLNDQIVNKYNEVAQANGAELVFPPVAFEVFAKTVKYDGTYEAVEISQFTNYVERVMEIPAGVVPSKITTGIVFNSDGSYSHVPTEVFQKDGKWFARLSSLTNSNYSVIGNSVIIKSVENHWSKDAVNDMASRLVIFNSESFQPDAAITRADFAEYIVRALGLYRQEASYENKFVDVAETGGRTIAIIIASEYGIVKGYPDDTFRPDALITREEAMTMYLRAMNITKLVGTEPTRYTNYNDFEQVGSWATQYVKDVLSARVFNGTGGTTLSPKSNLTYAEAAQAVKNLLVKANLINP